MNTTSGTHKTRRRVGPYTTLARLGHTNLSAIYRATLGGGGREVALRVLAPTDDLADIEGFLKELKVIAALRHEYVVPVLDYGVDSDVIYITMPFLSGGTLEERLRLRRSRAALSSSIDEDGLRPEALPAPGEITRMLRRIAMALDAVHRQGIVHHMLKPSNIMFDEHGRAYLADTGLAKLYKVIFSLQQTNAINTNDYSAPEQWQGTGTLPASDQYSLAGVLYQLVTGRKAFPATNVYSLMQKHLNDLPTPPHYVRRDLPGALTNVFVRAMAKEPEDRYPSTTALARDFAQAVRGHEGSPTDFFTFPVRGATAWQHHVFIAHSEEDAHTVSPLRDELRQRGLVAWGKHLARPGSITWTSLLGDAVRDAGVVVLLLTRYAPESNWVQTMLSYARQHERPVIALRADPNAPEDCLHFEVAQIVDGSSGRAASLDALAQAVKMRLAQVET